ncbi:MAG: hypothetical protein J6X02_05760, partial [Bacilli bacterium]|nr:hypothetical protein [Bacilli bacterium]
MYSEIDRLEEITKVMNDYLSRGDISVLRFCEVTKYSTKKFKHDLHYLKKQNKMALYYQVMAKIKKAEENKDQQLILDIFDILAIIKGLNGERGLSSMEFYCHTNYSIDEALLMAKRIFNTE